ncbi:MAG: NYN domain-containing protein [Deltaproteobacteria bacterium]|jgi:hypothetical protein|nr:NYN domain-containing protein [Deltaproteobacteria bacterium]
MSNPVKTTAAMIIDVENFIGGYIHELEQAGLDPSRPPRTGGLDIGPVCEAIIQMYGSLHFRISIGDIFYSCYRTRCMDLNLHLKKNFHDNFVDIHEVTNFDNVKDCSDFVIYTETLDLAYREESIDSFTIISMDKGFIPLYVKLKQLGKKVSVVGMSPAFTPELVHRVVDKVLYYTDLVDITKQPPADAPPKDAARDSQLVLVSAASQAKGQTQKDETRAPEAAPVGKKPEIDRFLIPETEFPEWVNFENYGLAEKIIKCVEKVLRCPVLSREHYGYICQMVEHIFREKTKNGSPIKMVALTDLVTDRILARDDLITSADLQEYNLENKGLDKLASKLVYKVIRTLYMTAAFNRLPNETNKTNDPTLPSFAEENPELLEHLFSAFFGFLKVDNLSLDPEPLTMAFYRLPTEENKSEIKEFIRKHKIYRSTYFNQSSKPQPFEILGSFKASGSGEN